MPIPIVGQSYERVSFVPIQTIICRCTPGIIRFLMLIGIGNRIECNCGRLYHIASILSDGTCDIVVELPVSNQGVIG